MRTLALLVLVALLAGCMQPAPPTAPLTGPVDLTGSDGLLLVDLEARAIALLSATASAAWISPSGAYVAWAERDYNVVQGPDGERIVAPATTWARVLDDATGIELAPGEARTRHLANATLIATAPLPASDRPGSAWTEASADLTVLGSESPGVQPLAACLNQLALRAQNVTRFIGCHLEVAADGRAGWTTGPEARIRLANGTVERITAAEGSTVENPVFSAAGVLYLRLHGDDTDVLARGHETALAKTASPHKLALHGVTDDGRYLLVTSFRP